MQQSFKRNSDLSENDWVNIEMPDGRGLLMASEPVISIRKDVLRFNSYIVRNAPSLFQKNRFAGFVLNQKRKIIACKLFQNKEPNTRALHIVKNSHGEPISASVQSKHILNMLKFSELSVSGSYGVEFRELETMKTGHPTFWIYLDQPK